MKKFICLLICLLTTISIIGCNTKTQPQQLKEDDFEFDVVFNVSAISSYNSRTGELIKFDHETRPEDYKTELVLSTEQLTEIKELLKEIDIFSYPEYYDPFNDPKNELQTIVTPSEVMIITVTMDNKTKTVRCENVLDRPGYDQKAQAYIDAFKKIIKTITDTPQWQSLDELDVYFN